MTEHRGKPPRSPETTLQDLPGLSPASTRDSLKDALKQTSSSDRVLRSFIYSVSSISAQQDGTFNPDLIIRTLQEFFSSDRIAIIRVDQDNQHHQIIAKSADLGEDQLKLMRSLPFPAATDSGNAIIITREENEQGAPFNTTMLDILSTESAVCLSIQMSSHTMWLVLGPESPGMIRAEHASLGQILFNLIGIQYSLHYEQQRANSHIKELEKIQDIALRINTTQSLDSTFKLILESVLDILPKANNAHIFLKQRGQLVFQNARWASGKAGEAIKHPRQDGLTARAAQRGEVMVVNDTRTHPLYANNPYDFDGSLVAVPFIHQHKTLGVMTVAYQTKYAATQDTLKLLKLFADQAAVAIENTRMNVLLQEQANTDRLTGLPNRRSLENKFHRELNRARRYGRKLSVLFLDLDNYKSVNDRYGHQTGDQLLMTIAHQLQQMTRESDLLFRYGGDEFIILLPETSHREATLTGQRIQNTLFTDPHVQFEHREDLCLGISYGTATFPKDGSTRHDLLRTADQSLYRNK